MARSKKRTSTREPGRPSQQIRPVYELRAVGLGGSDMELGVWELPTPSTPRLKQPEKTAALKGRALSVIEVRLARKLKRMGIRIGTLKKKAAKVLPLEEEDALQLALLFRALAPMRSIERIRMVSEGIEEMSKEEAGYWLGMAVHRKYPRRVLAALRVLLTTPYR